MKANEAESTLTYYFGVPEEYGDNMSASPQLLAFEQHRARSDLYDVHLHSKAMDTFLEKIPPTMNTGLDLTHYEDTAGFLDKADMKECGIFYDTRITAVEGKRDEVLQGLQCLAETVKREEKDTYTFLVLRSLDNEHGVRIFERYATKGALEEHWRGKALLDFWSSSKSIIKSMEGRGYIPNGWGWLHR